MTTERAELHSIIDELSIAQLILAKKLLEALSDTEIEVKPKRLYRLSDIISGVPIPEEEMSPEEAAELDRRAADLSKFISAEQLKKELGI